MQYLHVAKCWLLHFVLPESSVGSTKLSGRGNGQVFDRALVCGSNVSCKSVTISIWRPSFESPSIPRGGDGHGELNESIFTIQILFSFKLIILCFFWSSKITLTFRCISVVNSLCRCYALQNSFKLLKTKKMFYSHNFFLFLFNLIETRLVLLH